MIKARWFGGIENGLPLALCGLLCSALLACSTPTSPDSSLGVRALRITPPGAGRLAVGLTVQLRGTASDAGGTLDVTDSVAWSSSAPLVAKINAGGLVLTSSVGVTQITASS